ncbi:MAG: methyl-accepting chemotaxis protein, partial [Planctomycetes bacterium]|nr:methyl-accepting chemotaxis protein [Planctomycetota bacterium]
NAEESASASEELSAQAEQMNDVVGELVAMVGGATSSSRKSRKTSSTGRHDLSQTDHAFHSIASGTEKKAETKAAAKAIPLDDNDDFNEFNS